eukprot:Nk52_evm18s123 gene=Nk52_evmTU18s123
MAKGLLHLPFEIIVHIVVVGLNCGDVVRLSCVCKRLHRILQEQAIWRVLVRKCRWLPQKVPDTQYVVVEVDYRGYFRKQYEIRGKLWKGELGNFSTMTREFSSSVTAATVGLIGEVAVLVTGTVSGDLTVWQPNGEGSDFSVLAKQDEFHLDAITCVCVAEGCVFSGSNDSVARKLDLLNRKSMGYVHEDREKITSICCDGQFVVTGSTDKKGRVFDAESGRLICELVGHLDFVTCVIMNSSVIVTGSCDQMLRVFDMNLVRKAYLGSGKKEKECVASDAEAPRTVTAFKVSHLHADVITCISFDVMGRVLSCASDGRVKATLIPSMQSFPLNTETMENSANVPVSYFGGQGPFDLTVTHYNAMSCLSCYFDMVFCGHSNGVIKVYSLAGDLLYCLMGHAKALNTILLLKEFLIAVPMDKQIWFWRCSDA